MKPTQLLIILLLLPLSGFTQSIWDYDSLPKRNPNDLGFLGFSKHITDYRVESYINSKKTVKSISITKNEQEIAELLFNDSGWIKEKITTKNTIGNDKEEKKSKIEFAYSILRYSPTLQVYQVIEEEYVLENNNWEKIDQRYHLHYFNNGYLFRVNNKDRYRATLLPNYTSTKNFRVRKQISISEDRALCSDNDYVKRQEYFYESDSINTDTIRLTVTEICEKGYYYNGEWVDEPHKDSIISIFYISTETMLPYYKQTYVGGEVKNEQYYKEYTEMYIREGYKVKYEYY